MTGAAGPCSGADSTTYTPEVLRMQIATLVRSRRE